MSMFSDESAPTKEKQRKLESAVDAIRHKFGKTSISLGQMMKSDIGGIGHKTEEQEATQE